MYNLRYHIVSLVAVFLALTVGLLLGSIVVERGLLSSQQTTLVQGLQSEFDSLRTESAGLRTENAALRAFSDEVAPVTLQGVLAGRTILVLASTEAADTAAQASEAARLAGGTVAVATLSAPSLALSDPAVLTAVASALGVSTSSVDATRVIGVLAAEWTTPGDPRTLTRAMAAAGSLKLAGLGATATADGIAVAAAFGGIPDQAAIGLARAMAGPTRFAVGVGTTNREDGVAAAARIAGLSGVDNVDTPVGRVSFAWVLSGRASGYFGLGEGTTPYPSPLFGK